MRLFYEHIVVKVTGIFIEETPFKGIDGKTIILNPTFNPERHTRISGIVTSVPDELLRLPLAQDIVSRPAYHDHPDDVPVNTWKTNEDIELEIQEGDKVYFHYNCLLPDLAGESIFTNKMFLYSKKEMENGKEIIYHYFRIKYDLVYASVRYEKFSNGHDDFQWWMEPELKATTLAPSRDTFYMYKENAYRKKVTMIGSYCFIEPDMETWEDISIPVPETINGTPLIDPATGKVKLKPKEQWIVTKSMPGYKYLCGWIRFCGSPLKGDKEFVRPGMYVYFQKNADTIIEFEGVNYFRMRQRYILGIDYSKSNLYVTEN